MPVLENARHERFAQELAKGASQTDAYLAAGYKGDKTAASRLSTNVNVKARVEELKVAAAERAEVTRADVLRELAKIGFSDIRKAVKWYSQTNIAAVDAPEEIEGELEDGTVRFAVANQVELMSSGDIDDETAAAISEVSMTDKGSLKVKLHDKRAALVDIAKMQGWHIERHEHTGKDGGPIQYEEMSDIDALRRIRFLMNKPSQKEG